MNEKPYEKISAVVSALLEAAQRGGMDKGHADMVYGSFADTYAKSDVDPANLVKQIAEIVNA